MTFTSDFGEFNDCDLVVDAVVEDERAKADVFTEIDKMVKHEDAIFASHTSSIRS